MGKKGKRSKKKDAREKADKILRETDKLLRLGYPNINEGLYSKAANQFREVIQLLESKSELMIYTRERLEAVYFTLMHLEYRRWNHAAAIESYKFLMKGSYYREDAWLYLQMIMLRLLSESGEECQLSDFLSIIGQGNKRDRLCFEDAVLAFRAHKQFDSAIRLEMTFEFGSVLRSSELESKLSLALTYLEQYRLEFSQRSLTRKEDILRIDNLIDSLHTEHPLFVGDPFNYASPEYLLVLAQWYYLSHTRTIVVEEKRIVITSRMVKHFLFVGLMRDKGGRDSTG